MQQLIPSATAKSCAIKLIIQIVQFQSDALQVFLSLSITMRMTFIEARVPDANIKIIALQSALYGKNKASSDVGNVNQAAAALALIIIISQLVCGIILASAIYVWAAHNNYILLYVCVNRVVVQVRM
jgi:hypothetical protein